MDRREMLQKSAVLVGSMCLCRSVSADDPPGSTCCFTPEIEPECLTFLENSLVIDLEKTATLQRNGQAVYVDYQEKDLKMIVVRVKKNRYYALSRLCTHGGQALSYVPERKVLQCNSYNHSIFNLDGTVWKGPAPNAIRSFELIAGNSRLEIFI
jgi:nitrite reductase/ring-hydroxylating ferredoxin subunit